MQWHTIVLLHHYTTALQHCNTAHCTTTPLHCTTPLHHYTAPLHCTSNSLEKFVLFGPEGCTTKRYLTPHKCLSARLTDTHIQPVHKDGQSNNTALQQPACLYSQSACLSRYLLIEAPVSIVARMCPYLNPHRHMLITCTLYPHCSFTLRHASLPLSAPVSLPDFAPLSRWLVLMVTTAARSGGSSMHALLQSPASRCTQHSSRAHSSHSELV